MQAGQEGRCWPLSPGSAASPLTCDVLSPPPAVSGWYTARPTPPQVRGPQGQEFGAAWGFKCGPFTVTPSEPRFPHVTWRGQRPLGWGDRQGSAWAEAWSWGLQVTPRKGRGRIPGRNAGGRLSGMCQKQGRWMSAKPDRGLTPPLSPTEPVIHADVRTPHPPGQGSERRGCRRPGVTSDLCPPPCFSSGWVFRSFLKDEREGCGLRGPEAQRQDGSIGCDGTSKNKQQ